MTNEQKKALEEAAEQDGTVTTYSYIRGAQTILDNPEEWGLVEKRLVDAGIQLRIETVKSCEEVHSRNEKYREVLEAIKSECDPNNPTHEKIWRIAFNATKEALKQQ